MIQQTVFIRDGLRLDFGRLESKTEVSHYEAEVCKNIFGQTLIVERPVLKRSLILRMSDGIKTFKSQIEMDCFLSHFESYKIYSIDLIHREVSV